MALLRETWPGELPAPARSPLWHLYTGRTTSLYGAPAMSQALCLSQCVLGMHLTRFLSPCVCRGQTLPAFVLSGQTAGAVRVSFPLVIYLFFPNGKINHCVSPALRSAMWLWSLRAAGPSACSRQTALRHAGLQAQPVLGPGWSAAFLKHLTAPSGWNRSGSQLPAGGLGKCSCR